MRSAVLSLCGPSCEILKMWNIVPRRRKHFRGIGDLFGCWTLSKKRCLNTQEFTRFLSASVITASSHALWCVLSNKAIRVLGHCWVYTPHIHTSDWDSVFLKLFALHRHSHAEWLGLCQLKHFSSTVSVGIHTTVSRDREYDSSHSYHEVCAHPAVAVRNRWRL